MRKFPDPGPVRLDHGSAGRYLAGLVKEHRRALLAGVVFGVACMLAQALVPAAIGRAIDLGMIARDRSGLLLWGGVVLGLAIVQAVTGILRDRNALSASLGAGYQTMQLVTGQASRLGATLGRRVTTGEVVGVGTADIASIGGALETTARGSGAVVSIVAVAVIMVSTSWRLGLAVLIGVPLMTWLIALLIRPLHGRQERLRDQQGELASRAVDIVGGLRVLRGIGGEDAFAARYRAESQRVRHAGVEVARVEVLLSAAQVLLPGLLVAFVVWLGAHAVLDQRISPGQLVAFYGYTVFLAGPIGWLTDAVDRITKGFVAARRVTRMLALEPEIVSGPLPPGSLSSPAPLTDAVTGLVVPPGRFTAVACAEAGEAAALADRLGRYTDSGAAYGDIPLRDLPLTEVRRSILVVGPEGRFFTGPLRAELDPRDTSADGGGDRPELAEALWAAAAGDIVDALPDGLDTVLVQAGRELSGGQHQRLRLVRALMANPDVLVAVEPASAVDAHTEDTIAARLARARAGRTTVVLTTSPIVLSRADRVVLVAGGRVAAEGTHAGLLGDTRYRHLVTRETS
ncbi:ABC transporter transmembrane domain-containing protein [Sinosporangium siamense]|uniref:ABC transporter n=1 Tax=Sinosporangium siamense TaxID=1367973 RepID=A0A919RN58_9ACTN|nr:ABC transporter ATP-binding protein [Sinosporangium siamense]GII95261.1 ABC transporter [Sinosporangium siamense]